MEKLPLNTKMFYEVGNYMRSNATAKTALQIDPKQFWLFKLDKYHNEYTQQIIEENGDKAHMTVEAMKFVKEVR